MTTKRIDLAGAAKMKAGKIQPTDFTHTLDETAYYMVSAFMSQCDLLCEHLDEKSQGKFWKAIIKQFKSQSNGEEYAPLLREMLREYKSKT